MADEFWSKYTIENVGNTEHTALLIVGEYYHASSMRNRN